VHPASASRARHRPPIVPDRCFIDGDWPLITPPDVFRGVRLEGPRSLRMRLPAASVLGEGAIARLMRILGSALPPK
jgi:hypothetical protein